MKVSRKITKSRRQKKVKVEPGSSQGSGTEGKSSRVFTYNSSRHQEINSGHFYGETARPSVMRKRHSLPTHIIVILAF